MIRGKDGEEEGGWWSGEVKDGYGVGLWKSIMKDQISLLGCFSFVVCNGRRVVEVWTDKWCGDEPLCCPSPLYLS